jgi:hypothetical protein
MCFPAQRDLHTPSPVRSMGEGWGEGVFLQLKRALTLALSHLTAGEGT